MRFLSLFSGIEAASVAFGPLGFLPVAFAEREKFPSAVLAHHYPDVPNLGDVTTVNWNAFVRTNKPIDLVVFGSPCQSFSIAGRRLGMDDPRGNLALHAIRIISIVRPRWFLFENVPGLLSSGGGWDFGQFLAAVGDIGYYGAWRVLDAQYFGLAQRRKRLFFVGHSGDWRGPTAVLFEPQRVQGHSPPVRREKQKASGAFEIGPGGNRFTDLAPTLDARCKDGPIRNQLGLGVAYAIQERAVCENPDAGPNGLGVQADIAYTLEARERTQAVAFDCKAGGKTGFAVGDICGALRGDGFGGGHSAVAFGGNNRSGPIDLASGVNTKGGSGRMQFETETFVAQAFGVRRIMPVEAERLQGLPDNYTRIPWRRKPAEACPDGPRYRAIGNSFPVPVVRWIGRRIDIFNRLFPV